MLIMMMIRNAFDYDKSDKDDHNNDDDDNLNNDDDSYDDDYDCYVRKGKQRHN